MQERIGIVKSNHWKQNQSAEHMEAVPTRDFFFFFLLRHGYLWRYTPVATTA